MDLLTRLLYRGDRPRAQPTAEQYLAALPWRAPARPTAMTPAMLAAKVNAVMRALGGTKTGATDGR